MLAPRLEFGVDKPEEPVSQALPLRRHASPEDVGRANLYALLARLFAAPPDRALLHAIASAAPLQTEDDGAPLAQAWSSLIAAATVMDVDAAAAEYDALFGGVGKVAINLHASHHMAGAMMDKPLADLRDHLSAFGLGRLDSQAMPEDHVSALCEVMRILITGVDGASGWSIAEQRAFFMNRVDPWCGALMSQICEYPLANFYRVVAQWGREFFELEREAFGMV